MRAYTVGPQAYTPTLRESRGSSGLSPPVSVSLMRMARTCGEASGHGVASPVTTAMTPRATDWTLAALVAIGFATGGLTLYSGGAGDAWVFTLHSVAGLGLAAVLVWKLGRVAPRLRRPELRDMHSPVGIAALVVVVAALASGAAWSSGLTPYPLGISLLGWHYALGATLMLVVAAHASARARLP